MKKNVAKYFNNCFAHLELYNAKVIAPKTLSFKNKGNENLLGPVTKSELWKIIDKLPTEKSVPPEYRAFWALKDCKLSIRTQLLFASNECMNTNTFPNFLKEDCVTPVFKKGDRQNPENY